MHHLSTFMASRVDGRHIGPETEVRWIDAVHPLEFRSLCYAASLKTLYAAVADDKVAAIVVDEGIGQFIPDVLERRADATFIVVGNARSAVLRLYEEFPVLAAPPILRIWNS